MTVAECPTASIFRTENRICIRQQKKNRKLFIYKIIVVKNKNRFYYSSVSLWGPWTPKILRPYKYFKCKDYWSCWKLSMHVLTISKVFRNNSIATLSDVKNHMPYTPYIYVYKYYNNKNNNNNYCGLITKIYLK